MEVLVVSKTHMSNAACVGGLVLKNNRYVRLLNPGNYNQPTDTEFEVGDVYDLIFTNRTCIHHPHIEDVIISSKRFLRRVEDMPTFLKQKNVIDWNGHINNLFNGLLSWTISGTGYIPLGGQLPNKSVGFWIADKDLIRVSFENKVRFRYPNGGTYRNISYVGYQETLETIPAGTVLRVSLSRIFPPENSEIKAPRGFYLQLSGWYQEEQPTNQFYRHTIADMEYDTYNQNSDESTEVQETKYVAKGGRIMERASGIFFGETEHPDGHGYNVLPRVKPRIIFNNPAVDDDYYPF